MQLLPINHPLPSPLGILKRLLKIRFPRATHLNAPYICHHKFCSFSTFDPFQTYVHTSKTTKERVLYTKRFALLLNKPTSTAINPLNDN